MEARAGSTRAGRFFITAVVVAMFGILAALAAGSLIFAARWKKERDLAERARAEAVERLEEVKSATEGQAEEIYRLHLAQARAGRLTAQAGRGFAGLDAVRRAAGAGAPDGLSPAKVLELRNVAIACLALTDLRPKAEMEPLAEGGLGGHALDAALERCCHADGEGFVEVRSVGRGEVVRRLPPPEGIEVRSVEASFAPGGRLLAVIYRSAGGNAERLRLWDVDGGSVILEMPTGGGMDLSGDGSALAACGADGAIRVFRLPGGTEARRIGRGGNGTRVSLDAAGTRLAAAGEGRIAIFDVESGAETASVPREAEVLALAWSHGGRWLAAGGTDRRIRIHDATGRTRSRVLEGQEGTVASLIWSPADDLLASAGRDGTTRLWDTRSGDLASEIPAEVLRFHREGKLLGTVRDAHIFGVWEIARGGILSTLRPARAESPSPWSPRHSIQELAFSRDGRWLASAQTDGVRILDPGASREAAHLPIGFVASACFDPRTGALITLGELGLIRWPFTAGDGDGAWSLGPPEMLDLSGRSGPQRAAFDREGRLVSTVLAGGQAIIFDAIDPAKRTALPIGSDISALSLSPDGRWLAVAGSKAPRATVWDLKTGRATETLTPAGASPTDGALSTVFSPDGAWLAVGWTRGVAIWRAGSWEPGLEVKRARREEGSSPVAFHPGGSALALARDPTSVLLVELPYGRELAALTAPVPRLVSRLAFSPAGDILAVAAEDRAVQLWDLRALRESLGALGLAGEPPLPAAVGPAAADRTAAPGVTVIDAESPGRSFRERRLAILEADLASWTWDLAGSDAETRSRVLEKLADPLGDPVLRGVEDGLRSGTLPPAEQAAWEGFVERARTLHAELAAGAPPPKVPVNRRPPPGTTAETAPVLESSPFAGGSPDAAHGWSRWQVRTVLGSFDVSPSIDILSGSALTTLRLPRGLLLPRTTCFWRVAHVGAAGRLSDWSSETPFTTASSWMRLERIDLSAAFNKDVVADPKDSRNDAFAPGPPVLLTAQGFDGSRADNPEARGLPRDRLVGDHLLGDYRGPNSIQLAPGDRKPVRVAVPRARYAAIRCIVSGGRGDSRIPVGLEYAGGAMEKVSLPCDDWTKDLPLTRSDRLRSGATGVWRKMDHIRGGNLVNDDAAALFEVILPANDAEELTALILSPVGAEFQSEVTRFNLLAVTAMTPE